MVALVCVGLALVSIDLFPNLWNKISNNTYGQLVTKGIKALALLLIACAFWIRIYQNMSDIEEIFTDNIKSSLEKDKMISTIQTTSDKIFDKIFEVVLSLILASILPAVGAWTAYQRDPKLLEPTEEWKNQPDEPTRRKRRLSHRESYPNSHPYGGPP